MRKILKLVRLLNDARDEKDESGQQLPNKQIQYSEDYLQKKENVQIKFNSLKIS